MEDFGVAFWLLVLASVIVGLAQRDRVKKLQRTLALQQEMLESLLRRIEKDHTDVLGVRRQILRVEKELETVKLLGPAPAPAERLAPDPLVPLETIAPVERVAAVEKVALLETVAAVKSVAPADGAAQVAAVAPAETGAESDSAAPPIADTSAPVEASGESAPLPAGGQEEAAPGWPPPAPEGARIPQSPNPPLSQIPPPPPPPPPSLALPAFNWESLVGVRLFSWIAGVALVLAGVFFLRYSIDQGWMTAPIRMAMGLAVGISLLVACEWKGRGYRTTANALDAAGIAILFSTIFASNALWHLIPQILTFALMALVTAVAVLLSIRHNSLYIALLGLVGGFATPILLSSGEDRPIGLFAYLLLLNGGLAWVAHHKRWPLLVALSLGFTTLYQWGWVTKFLLDKPAELPIAAAAFLVFPVLIAVSQLLGARKARHDGTPLLPLFHQSATAATLLPLLFAVCMAWVPSFGRHHLLLFGFLLVLDVGLAVLAVALETGALHVGGGLATIVVFAGWFAASYEAAAWPLALGFVALFVVLYLLAPEVARRLKKPFGADASRGTFTAPLLLFSFPALALIEPQFAHPALPFIVLFALASAVAVTAILTEVGGLHFIAAFFAIAAEACWSAKYLVPERLHAALALYAVLGLFYLGVPIAARTWKKPLRPEGSGVVILLAALAMLFFLTIGPVAHAALWGLALLLAVLNLGLFLEGRSGRLLPLLALSGMLLSWVLIAVWWATAMVAALFIPALVVVAGFAVLILGGSVWATGKKTGEGEAASPSPLGQGLYLGLIGHLFLLFVATQPSLAVPPWPVFGVLFVLDLAIVAAALYARRAELHIAAIVASQIVLLVWVLGAPAVAAPGLPWADVGLLATIAVCALGFAVLPLSRRRQAPELPFIGAAAGGLFLAQVLCAVVGTFSVAAPGLGWLVISSAVLLGALAWLAASEDLHWLLLVGLLPVSVGLMLWEDAHAARMHWSAELVYALVPYVIASVYPVLLGARARVARTPFLIAVLASAPFFMATRNAMIRGGHAGVIGILPVGEALVLAGLLLLALRLAPAVDKSRDRGRLAFIAGAALAFITAAIPLQLDNEWITIAWALEAAALAWLYQKLNHKGLLLGSAGLAAAVVARLSLNRAVFDYHARSAVPVFNWYLYAYLVSALALIAAGWLLRATDDRPWKNVAWLPRTSHLQWAGGTLLLFLLLNIEIADYYSTGREITFNFSSTLAQDLTYTLGWALFAVTLLAIGIWQKGRAVRIAALVLLLLTVAKCFLHDLWRLGGLYRVGSFVGLAVCLALVAVVLQKFVLGVEDGDKEKAVKKNGSLG